MASPRRLTRSPSDRKVAGVCGGLGDYFDIDPVIFRIGFLVAALAGAGVLVYLAAWIALPEAGAASVAGRPGQEPARSVSTVRLVVGAILLVIGLGAVFSGSWHGPFGWGLFAWSGPALVIVAVAGAALWMMRDDRPPRRGRPVPPPTGAPPGGGPVPADPGGPIVPEDGSAALPTTAVAPYRGRRPDGTAVVERDPADAAGAGLQATGYEQPEGHAEPEGYVPTEGYVSTEGYEQPEPFEPPEPTGPGQPGFVWQDQAGPAEAPEPDRRPSATMLTVAALAVFAAIATLGSSAGLWDVSFAVGLGFSLVIVAAGLVSSIWLRGGALLIPMALLLVPVTAVVSRIDAPLTGGTGQRTVPYRDAADLDDERLLAGRLTLDFSELSLPAGESYDMDASVGFGRLRVIPPDDPGVVLEIESDVTFGDDRTSRSLTTGAEVDDPAVLRLDLEVGAGEIVLVN